MPLRKGLGLNNVQSSTVNENLKDELTLSNESMKRSNDNVSSTVPPHQKEKDH